jgi:GDP-L-fucose synthase
MIDFYKGKRVCVTGGSGLIGSYAVKLLKDAGVQVRAIIRTRRPTEFTRLADQLVEVDLMDPRQAERAVRGCEIVIGCAGITGGIGLAHLDPVSYVGPATVLACNTIHACYTEKVERYGFLSSTTVYPESGMAVAEGDEVCGPPFRLYEGIGESKRYLEKLARYYHEKTGLKAAVVRPSGAYGRFDNFDESTSHVVPGLINRALKGAYCSMCMTDGSPGNRCPHATGTFELWGDGGDTRDFVHAEDVARGLLLATASGYTHAMPFNIASGRGVTTRELAETVLAAVGSRAEIVLRPDKPTAMRTRLVSIEKARRLLGYEPTISLADGIADVVKWRRSS